jgi:hypothetical protein
MTSATTTPASGAGTRQAEGHGNGRKELGAVISVNGNGQARRARAARRQNRMMMLGIGLGVASRLLRDPRFQAQTITAAIGLAVLKRAAKESQGHTLGRLAAWDKKQSLRHQPNAKVRPA